jgi:DNA helicase-2/ATP-dependent DNA helicase PcrA
MQCNNTAIIAAAGSRKTTFIVEEAIKLSDKKILITTYTNENVQIITSMFYEKLGYVPDNIRILSWFSFLLQDGARPYQNQLISRGRIKSINFISERNRFIKKSDVNNYFIDKGLNLYCDLVTDFICSVNTATDGLVIKRLEDVYDYIFIDEVQDLSGYDLTFLEAMFQSSVNLVMVGDPRQSTFRTNRSSKNKAYLGQEIFNWFLEMKGKGLCLIEERNECFRSNQTICDFADNLYPDLPKTVAKEVEVTGHDGIFSISPDELKDYYDKYKPIALRYSRATDTKGIVAVNIGVSKGQTYDRVLVFATNPMKKYLKTSDPSHAGDIPKLYVAVTRARYSVAFVV